MRRFSCAASLGALADAARKCFGLASIEGFAFQYIDRNQDTSLWELLEAIREMVTGADDTLRLAIVPARTSARGDVWIQDLASTAAYYLVPRLLKLECMTSDGPFDYDPPRVLNTTTESRMELEMLLAEGFGVSPESMYRVLEQHLADELYTVTYENKIVACVFVEPAAFDLDGGVKGVNVNSLTVSPQHRRRGIASRLLKLIKKKASKDRMLWIQLQVEHKEDRSHELLLSMYRQHGFIVQYFNWLSGMYLLICDIDCVSEQICVNNEIEARSTICCPDCCDDFDVSLLMSLLTNDDCILEEICVNNKIDADDFDVSLLTIDDDIFEYHERNVQRKKCARKSESRRSQPKLRERVASGCRSDPGPVTGQDGRRRDNQGKVILKSMVRPPPPCTPRRAATAQAITGHTFKLQQAGYKIPWPERYKANDAAAYDDWVRASRYDGIPRTCSRLCGKHASTGTTSTTARKRCAE
jgi:ribosomal protein S18 acetylase RimI-like enzyme